ncbi:MAG: hypothetical protein H6Q37_2440 [Chloroflexi bacterium]|jgi:hypothetical protein|nr:hypothetical protein [Chloroflexota bacterium]
MDESKFNQWINKVLTTEEDEISCSDCFDRVSDYAEAEIVGAEMDAALQQVKQHIHQCQVCFEEYELLRDLIQIEDGHVSSLDK